MRDHRLQVLKGVLWALVGVLGSVTVVRFVHGLGAVTHLSDAAPWGIWVGFDVMSGVALAAGGFVLAAAVHVFGLERFRPFVRPAILTALLGYAAVAVGLLYDLGLPWRIWHPMFHPQVRSVLFEVAMCVMLYLTVLSLEFAPVILEHPLFSRPPWAGIHAALRRATLPLVIAGIVLSTLHQSSLGSLFLITPQRLHPLWYSPIIHVLFFVSAVGLGLMTVILESVLSRFFLGHEPHQREIAGLGAAASAVLWLYAAVRIGDLARRGLLGTALDGSGSGLLFLGEILASAVLPAALLLSPRVRSSLRWTGACAALSVGGMVLYRVDVSILCIARPAGTSYFPSWEEFAVSLGIVAAFTLVFIRFVEHLRVYGDVGAGNEAAPGSLPAISPDSTGHLLPRDLSRPRWLSAAALAGASLSLLFLPLAGAVPVHVPVSGPRVVEGTIRDGGPGGERAVGFAPDPAGAILLLMIDGNRDGNLVLFNHDGHRERLGGRDSCAICHHLNLPFDRASGCFRCHRDMYGETSVFDHARHVAALRGAPGCAQCHAEGTEVKGYGEATPCAACHRHEAAAGPGSFLPPPAERWRPAPGYRDALHRLCIGCHHGKAGEGEAAAALPAEFDQCRFCHDVDRGGGLDRLAPAREAR
jgi:Ni/Fe-hydrogenase subunit HybB-like protein